MVHLVGSRVESIRDKVLLMKLKMKAEGSDSIPLVTLYIRYLLVPFHLTVLFKD